MRHEFHQLRIQAHPMEQSLRSSFFANALRKLLKNDVSGCGKLTRPVLSQFSIFKVHGKGRRAGCGSCELMHKPQNASGTLGIVYKIDDGTPYCESTGCINHTS